MIVSSYSCRKKAKQLNYYRNTNCDVIIYDNKFIEYYYLSYGNINVTLLKRGNIAHDH